MATEGCFLITNLKDKEQSKKLHFSRWYCLQILSGGGGGGVASYELL